MSKAVIIVASEEWDRKTGRQDTLADFFADSPLRDSGLEVERPQDGPRELDLCGRDYLDDVEDLQLGLERLQDAPDPILDLEDVKRELLGRKKRSGDA